MRSCGTCRPMRRTSSLSGPVTRYCSGQPTGGPSSSGETRETTNVDVWNLLVVPESADENLVYQITKTMFEKIWDRHVIATGPGGDALLLVGGRRSVRHRDPEDRRQFREARQRSLPAGFADRPGRPCGPGGEYEPGSGFGGCSKASPEPGAHRPPALAGPTERELDGFPCLPRRHSHRRNRGDDAPKSGNLCQQIFTFDHLQDVLQSAFT